MMPWYDGSGYGWPAMVLIMSGLVLFIGLAVWGIARLTRTDHHAVAVADTSSPRSVLDERFANGELDDETYARMRRMLDGSGSPESSTSARRP